MKYLITGGCGFIGSHIAEEILARDADASVVIYDNLRSGHRENVDLTDCRVDLVVGDIRDAAGLAAAMGGVDYVFHEAALVSVFESVDDPGLNHDINLNGTLNVLTAARDAGVRRVMFAASAAAYGDNSEVPKRETMRPEPESPYALAKVGGEYYMSLFAKLYGVETVSLRYFNVYGPRQDPSSMYSGVISKFTDTLARGEDPTVFGDGGQTRDFVYVKDVARANWLAAMSDAVGQGEVINIATGRSTSLLDLLDALGQMFPHPFATRFAPVRAGDVRHSLADITRAKELLNYTPVFSLREGLGALVESLRQVSQKSLKVVIKE
ncbi:MAG: NAD-dependent epimerase/dehydratase family protein [Lentisphaeria bacterium]|nr:NAD-dependent epimerase/dehydratase family protein [Lentisphaeria bacterium]